MSNMKNSIAVKHKAFQRFKNDTGAFVFLALQAFEEPATADQIVSLIADGKKVRNEIFGMLFETKARNPPLLQFAKDAMGENIRKTLEEGVSLGFLGKENRRYYLPMTKEQRDTEISSKSKTPMKACKKVKGSVRHCSNCCLSKKDKNDEKQED